MLLRRPCICSENASLAPQGIVDMPAIEALLRVRPTGANPENLVFCTDRGTALNPNNVRNRVLVSACKRAKIPQVSWHNFRYTYATWADPSGESIKALQAQLGHTDSRLTLSVYTQPMPEAQRRVAAKVAGILLPIAAGFEESEEARNAKPLPVQ